MRLCCRPAALLHILRSGTRGLSAHLHQRALLRLCVCNPQCIDSSQSDAVLPTHLAVCRTEHSRRRSMLEVRMIVGLYAVTRSPSCWHCPMRQRWRRATAFAR